MNWIAILKVLGEALAPLIAAYAEARKLAAQDGVTPEQLAEADARWTKDYADPLAGEPEPDLPVPPASGARYLTSFAPPIPDDATLRGPDYGFNVGDQVCAEDEDSQWMVARKGSSRMGANLLRTIGEA